MIGSQDNCEAASRYGFQRFARNAEPRHTQIGAVSVGTRLHSQHKSRVQIVTEDTLDHAKHAQIQAWQALLKPSPAPILTVPETDNTNA